jgi:C1A family cysteine protease
MFRKKLFLVCAVFIAVLFVAGTLSFADNLADVQKKIKENRLKWNAKEVPNPEERGLGLLDEGFTVYREAAVAEGQVQAVALPVALDWRNIGADNLLGVQAGDYVTPVKDQGNCGSCWAFATTATAESATHISLNDPINILDSNSDYDLSELDMLNCSGAGSCNGGYITTASNYARDAGLLQEKPVGCYAYSPSGSTTPYSYCPNPASTPACDQNRYTIDSWGGVSATVASIKNALNMYGPLVTTFGVYNDFYRYYSSGVYEATSCDTKVNPYVGGHAVSVVGYQDADATHPIGYFIVKNSWGNGWGETAGGIERGYFRIGYSQVGNCVYFGGSTLAYAKTACSGSINVTSPTTSDTWQAGNPYDIKWNATGSIGQYVKIDLYQGSTFIKTIQSSTPLVNGTYTWVVDSNLQGPNYAITITSMACASVVGASGYFTIGAIPTFGAQGKITTSDPTRGIAGVTMTFSRVSGNGTVPAPVTTLTDGTWSQTGFRQGTTYRVTPSLKGYTFSPSTSSNFSAATTGLNFTGTPPTPTSITVTYPDAAGLPPFKTGSTVKITWKYTGNPGSFVKIELLQGEKAGVLSSKAQIGSGGTGSYSWKISRYQAAGTTFKIRITSTSNSSVTDTSDNYFQITR